MHTYLVAYDIFDKKRLPKVRKIVASYTLGGQKSALEVPLNRSLMINLIKELENIIEEQDKINIIKINDNPILLGKAQHIVYKKNGVIVV